VEARLDLSGHEQALAELEALERALRTPDTLPRLN
jgi:hypothetical protein